MRMNSPPINLEQRGFAVCGYGATSTEIRKVRDLISTQKWRYSTQATKREALIILSLTDHTANTFVLVGSEVLTAVHILRN
jgi:hypothetical protein